MADLFSQNFMQLAAIFTGNYLANKSKALEAEQIIKVILQSATITQAIDLMKMVGIPEYGFLKDYMDSILMVGAIAGSSIVFDAVLEAAQGKPVNLNKEDVKKGLLQGVVVAAGNLTRLY